MGRLSAAVFGRGARRLLLSVDDVFYNDCLCGGSVSLLPVLLQ